MAGTSVGFVGTVGGCGTTQSILDIGGVLARNGERVLVFDLDFATQGLAQHVDGTIAVDSTGLVADPDETLRDAVREWAVEGDGRFEVVPSLAPFVEIAAAKSEAAGARVGERLEEAAERADWVLVDVPPVVSNQAIGAVTSADQVIAVLPPSDRGVDALQRERGRLADVGGSFDAVLTVGPGDPPPDATAHLPERPGNAPAHRPATLSADGSFTRAVGAATATLLDVSIDIEERDGPLDQLGGLSERLGT
ncbi:MAG: ParA family protein [Halodesulfurarchaeum sp.]|nr:ParA family protein [Halodesulfurarchaeum sp.]